MSDSRNIESGELIAHYQFIVGLWTEYYKLYMQSWSIFSSAILVGLAIALSKFGDGSRAGDIPQSILAIVPIVILVWFLLTSFFWAMFQMYARYASDLESQIKKIINNDVAYSLFSINGSYWFQNKKRALRCINALAGGLCMACYTMIVYKVSSLLMGFEFWFVFGGYMTAMVLTISAIVFFIVSNALSSQNTPLVLMTRKADIISAGEGNS